MTVDLDVQNRFIKIAQHCRMLADAEERDAESKGLGQRSGGFSQIGLPCLPDEFRRFAANISRWCGCCGSQIW